MKDKSIQKVEAFRSCLAALCAKYDADGTRRVARHIVTISAKLEKHPDVMADLFDLIRSAAPC